MVKSTFNTSTKGNIFALLFAAVGLTGVLGVVGMQTVSGPVRTITKVTQKNITDTDLMTNARVMILNASTLPSGGDGDSDGYIEPAQYRTTNCALSLTGGGCLPDDVGAILTDPWGTEYGYCVWDHGSTTNGKDDAGTGTDNRLNGETTTSRPVLAIISAGSNKTFDTSCGAFGDAGVEGLSDPEGAEDDVVRFYSYEAALAGSGGLWSESSGDAVIANPNVTNRVILGTDASVDVATGSFSTKGNFQTEGNVNTDWIDSFTASGPVKMATGLKLDDIYATCNASNSGVLRYNAGAVEYCNGTSYVELAAAGNPWQIIDDSFGANTYISVAGTDNSANTDVIVLHTAGIDRVTISPTGVVDIVGDADVGGTFDVAGNTSVGGNTSLGDSVTDTTTISGDLVVDTDKLIVDVATGFVGINKAIPAAALDVVGNGSFTGSLDVGTSAVIGTDLAVDGDTLVVDSLNDFVGINKTPTVELDVFGSAAISGSASISGDTSVGDSLTVVNTIQIGDGACSLGSHEGRIQYNTTDNDVEYCDGVSWKNIDTPSAIGNLDDIGDVNIGKNIAIAVDHGIAWDGTEWVNKPISASTATNADFATALIDDDSDTKIEVDTVGDGSGNTTIFTNNGAESLRITADGVLQVSDYINGNGSNIYGLRFDSNNRPIFEGINGSSYSLTLENASTNSGARVDLNMNNGTGVNGAQITSYKESASNDFSLRFNTWDISSGILERMRIGIDGNLGIGTTSPDATALLDVASTTRGFLAPRMTTAQRDAITSPATGLQVYNTSTNSHDYYNGTSWVALLSSGGAGVVSEINDLSDAYHDIATDFDGDTIDDDDNLAIGHTFPVLDVTNPGARNIAVGANSLVAVTTGDDNTVIGYDTGKNISTGRTNTLLGAYAGTSVTSGNFNTAVGFYAGADLTTGDLNSFLGYNTGKNSTGGLNTAIGASSLFRNTSGTGNTTLGYQAAAGTSNGAINNNTAIGKGAGQLLVTGGNNNVFLGYQAGDASTTGANNIIVGYDIDTSSATASEELNIGGILFGDIGTTSTDPRIGAHKYCDETLTTCFTASDAANADNLLIDSDGDTQIQVEEGTDDDTIRFDTLGTERLTIDESGNIGITGRVIMNQGWSGTDNIIYLKNETSGAVDASMGMFAAGAGSGGANDGAYMVMRGNSYSELANQRGNIYYVAGNPTTPTSTEGSINFWTGSDISRMVINNTGAVGIGTTSPAATALLDISSTTRGFLAPRMTTVQRDAITTPATGLQVYNTDTNTHDYYNGTAWISFATSAGSAIVLADVDNDTKIQVDESGLDEDTIRFDTAGSQRMIIDEVGKIGIGNTSPDHLLDVGNGNMRLWLSTSTNSAADPYGLGFTSGAGEETRRFTIASEQLSNRQALQFGDVNGGGNSTYFGVGHSTDSGTNYIPDFVINGVGDIGIGTNAPTEKLHISEGNIFIDKAGAGGKGFKIGGGADANTSAIYTTTYGHVEYVTTGTSDHSFYSGNSTASGNQIMEMDGLTRNVAIEMALNVGNETSSLDSTAILQANSTTRGFLAPRMTTLQRDAITTPATGLQVYNTDNNSHDYYNGTSWVALLSSGGAGVVSEINDLTDAFHDTTTDFDGNATDDDDNLAIGHTFPALDVTNPGARNMTMGATAGDVLTEGDDNIIIGYNAGKNLTGGSYNVLVGSEAGESLVDSNDYDNTFIGYRAGRANTKNKNTFIGSDSGRDNTGANNTFVGTTAGYQNTGSSNVMLGMNTGGLGGGSNNIFVGRETGAATTDGNNNILLGYQIDASAATASYEMNIGNILYGILDDPATVGVDEGKIGIGTNNPADILTLLGGKMSIRETDDGFDAVHIGSGTTTGYISLFNGGTENVYISSGNTNDSYFNSGPVVFGNTTANASAKVQIDSTTRGFLAPRMTTVQRDAITTPATGLQVYNTDTNTHDYYNGTAWISFATSAGSAVLLTDADGDTKVEVEQSADEDVIRLTANGLEMAEFNAITNEIRFQTNAGGGGANPDPVVITDNKITIQTGANSGVGASLELNHSSDFDSAEYHTIAGRFTNDSGTSTRSSVRLGRSAAGTGLSANQIGYLSLLTADTGDVIPVERIRIAGAGNVGIGTASPAATALLDISSTTRGFLAPRMTTVQRDAITTPAAGLQVYNTDNNSHDYYNGTSWVALLSSGSAGVVSEIDDLSDAVKDASNNLFLGTENNGFNGGNNIAIGLDTLSSSGSASAKNIAIGNQVLKNITTGDDNVSIGDSAMIANSTGGSNVAIGKNSFVNNLGGTNNVAIGASVAGLLSVANGDYESNVLIGSAVAYNAQAGANYNTIVGANGGSALTTGTYNILLGYNTDTSSATASNELNIGDSVFGNLATGQIGIGVADATAINGTALLDISSTTRGFLAPRMTTIQRDAIATPATGLQVYNTDTNTQDYYNGTAWISFATGASTATQIADADNNTKIQVEEAADENIIRFDTNGTERMAINANGTINIGGPAFATTAVGLTIRSGAIALDDTLNNDYGFIGQYTGLGIGLSGNASGLTSPDFYVAQNGEVGIGILQPTGIFDVVGSTTEGFFLPAITAAPVDTDFDNSQFTVWLDETAGKFQFKGKKADGTVVTQTVGASGAVTEIADADNNTKIQVEESANEDKIRFDTAGTERVIIDENGNIGIGTSSPSAYMHLLGDNKDVYLESTNNTLADGGVDMEFRRSRANAIVLDDDKIGGIRFEGHDGATFARGAAIYAMVDGTPGVSDMPTRLEFHTAADGAVIDATPEMMINANGNVMLGNTTNPLGVLDIARYDASSNMQLVVGNGSSGRAGIRADGGALTFHRYFGGGFQDASFMMKRGSGQIGINVNDATTIPDSAQFEIRSTTRGFLAPSMTTAQRDLIATPVAGLQVYNTTTNTHDYYNGTAWISFATGASTATILADADADTKVEVEKTADEDIVRMSAGGYEAMSLSTATAGNTTNTTFSNGATSSANQLSFRQRAGTQYGYVGYDGSSMRVRSENSAIVLQTNGANTRMSIQNNGNIVMDTNTLTVDATNNRVGVGTATPAALMQITGAAANGDYLIDIQNTTSSGEFMQMVAADGLKSFEFSQTSGGSGLFSVYNNDESIGVRLGGTDGNVEYRGVLTDISDRRMKTDIVKLDANEIVNRISKIDTYSFKMKNDTSGRTEFGVMAQELENVFPELVETADDKMQTKSVNYIGLIAPMIEATKTLQQENISLKTQLSQVKLNQDKMLLQMDDLKTNVRGIQAHTGYGIHSASYANWVMLGLLFIFGSIITVTFIRRQPK